VAGDAAAEQPTAWRQVAGPPDALSTEYVHHAGVYAAGDRLLAVNRAAAEDQPTMLTDERVAGLFQGLSFIRVDDRPGGLAGLIHEIWRPFLVAMLIALLVEAGLCLPRRAQNPQSRAPVEMGRSGEPSRTSAGTSAARLAAPTGQT
jgi:hypothetical protein